MASLQSIGALKSFSLQAPERLIFVIGPGEMADVQGTTYLVITSAQVVLRVKKGWSDASYKTYPHAELRGIQTLSISSDTASAEPRIDLKINALPPFRFTRVETCHQLLDDGSSLVQKEPIDLWHVVISYAEHARGTWHGDWGGYPARIVDSMMLYEGERAIDCLFGRIETAESGVQVGGILLTNARCIFFRRGQLHSEASSAVVQLADDGGYTLVKSQPIDKIRQVAVFFSNALPQLRVDDTDRFSPVLYSADTEARLRRFAEIARQERNKFALMGSPAGKATVVASGRLCPECRAPNEQADAFCSACGAPMASVRST